MASETSRAQQAQRHLFFSMAVLAGFAGVLLVFNYDFLRSLFLADPLTSWSNGMILFLFLLGMWKLDAGLRRFAWEEQQVLRISGPSESSMTDRDPELEISPRSMIGRRFSFARGLYERRVPLNQAAMASIMVAEESQHLSFLRFVHSVLILGGVLGTIISMLLALLGARSVISSTAPAEGIGFILSGMNTALTTTATAITCFFFFSYSYQRFLSVQSSLFARIERAVMISVLPRFTIGVETVHLRTNELVNELRGLVSELHVAATSMKGFLDACSERSRDYQEKAAGILLRQERQIEGIQGVNDRLLELEQVLLEGFRLGRRDLDPSPHDSHGALLRKGQQNNEEARP